MSELICISNIENYTCKIINGYIILGSNSNEITERKLIDPSITERKLIDPSITERKLIHIDITHSSIIECVIKKRRNYIKKYYKIPHIILN